MLILLQRVVYTPPVLVIVYTHESTIALLAQLIACFVPTTSDPFAFADNLQQRERIHERTPDIRDC